ncbi:MAG: dihydrofolate reductase [Prevotellaceae bacterium]|nr:dihydrofolate reductase [Prevotellaceae bacterium]
MISIIVAVAENGIIGKNNSLLWHISEDLRRFKQLTENNTVIMGRKTYFSLPFRPLKNRRNIVISESLTLIDGAEVVNLLQHAFELCKNDREVFIIGGASIYRQSMDLADRLYLTKVYKAFEGDTFFPEIDTKKWQLTDKSETFYDEKADLNFSYLVYDRIVQAQKINNL